MKWIRLWVDDTINGTTFMELDAEHRGVWFTLLLLAGYSPKPGTICIVEGVAYTREQLAAFTKLSLDSLTSGIDHLASESVGKIKVNEDGTLSICNWLKYQTEYDRQKGYRRGLQGKVTKKGYKEKSSFSSVSVSVSVSPSVVPLPKGLSEKTWDEFREFRASIKSPMTPVGEARLLKRLAKLSEKGDDPEEVVSRSIENTWTGLFPLPKKGGTHATCERVDNSAPGRVRAANGIRR